MLERGERLRQYQFQWPSLNPALLASLMWWMMLIVIATGVVWAVSAVVRHRLELGEGKAVAGQGAAEQAPSGHRRPPHV
jgi:hypothetical protein